MSDELEAIRARHEAWQKSYDDDRYYSSPNGYPKPKAQNGLQAHYDRAALLSALTDTEARAVAAEERVRELSEALVQHNDRLRSAIAVADRNGAETNWKTLRGELHYTAAEYHELVNFARTLKGNTP